MENIQKTGVNPKTKRDRSTAYPAIALNEAIELSDKLIKAYTRSSSFSRDHAAKAMGYNAVSGASAPKVAALAHFGLLEKGGGSFRNSELASRIINYTSEEDKKLAILEAVTRPKLFRALIDKYAGGALPGLLKNVLINDYQIAQKVADNVVQIFKDSIEFAGIYSNGVVSENPQLNSLEETDTSARQQNTQPLQDQQTGVKRDEPLTSQKSFKLPSGITILYPTDLEYLFHIGAFAAEIKQLDEVVKKAKKETDENDPRDDIASSE